MTILASDDFNRADSVDLGASWDPCTGESQTAGLQIGSNAVLSQGGGDASETYNATSTNDGYCEVTYGATDTTGGAGAGMGPTFRAATGATVTYYRLIGNLAGYEFGKKVAGAFTSLSSGTGTTFAAGDKARIEFSGTSWSIKKNGVQFASGTDSSIASGRAGIAYSSTDETTTVTAWELGDLGGAGKVTKNTRSNPLGVRVGMGWRMPG